MSIRTRLAPSPTGYMHIGNLRTALWDYFLARQSDGQFIIRIEDTDQTRLVPGALESLLTTFQKLGIEHDEGPFLTEDGSIIEKGNFGPYIQSRRLDLYRKYADQLLANGDAYPCFCSKERLEEMRTAQTAAKMTPKYDRFCLSLSQEEVQRRLAAGESHVIRLKIPDGISEFNDAIRGRVSFQNSDIDDQVLIKTDGFSTYHLAVVVDDHLMKITHVLRGEEWLSSTPKQIILHRMLGWDMPVYAHVPLLLNPDHSKLSKRQGDVAAEDYLEKGYLPEALKNFLATLGFNPTADREIFAFDELIQSFDLSKVNKGGAVMNAEKLDWMNRHYIGLLNEGALADAAQPFVSHDLNQPVFRKALWIERTRVSRLAEFEERLQAYTALPAYEPSLLVWKKSTVEDARKQLSDLLPFLSSLSVESWKEPGLLEASLRQYSEERTIPAGNLFWPLRTALSGLSASPGPFELLWVFGKEESLQRISYALHQLEKNDET
ncbi:MAG TPA: glutamate--tRNA ligase [Patescibacteria group bacterium]|nr:glutamate--tRNA ligase [Patescibacteria group bacterium]